MPPGKQKRVVGTLYSSSQHATQDPAPVYKERNMLARTFITARSTDIAAHNRSIIRRLCSDQGNHLIGSLQTIDLDQGACQLTIPWRRKDLASITENAKTNLGIGQRILLQQVMTMAYLSVATLQKFQTRRYSTKKIAHRHRRPLWRSCRRNSGKLSIGSADLCSLCRILLPAQQRHLRHRCNTRQRFSTKPERTNMFQIINPILNQFFHNRGRPLHHLSRRNLRSNIRLQLSY